MFFLFPKTRTIKDDRGKSHIISWAINAGDEGQEYLSRRIGAEFSESMGWGLKTRVSGQVVFFVLLQILIMGGVMVLMANASISRAMGSFICMALMGLAMFVIISYTNHANRAVYQRAALMSVEEGACGSCWYDVRAIPTNEEGMLICPECQAAWLASRVRDSVREMDANADLLRHRRSSDHQEIETLARHFSLDLPTAVKDQQGRVFSLVRSRNLRSRGNRDEGPMRVRYFEAARSLRSAGIVRRLATTFLLLLLCGGMLVGSSSRMPNRSQSIVDWMLWLMMLYVIVFMILRGIGTFFRTDGVKPARATLLLLARSLCPSCGSSLSDIKANSDGLTICAQCSAAWNLADKLTPNRCSSCPSCHGDIRDFLNEPVGRRVCGTCGHVMAAESA